MAPSRWATPDQDTFLQSHVAGFIEARKLKRFDRYWSKLFVEWSLRWPERKTALPNVPDSVLTEDLDDVSSKILEAAVTSRQSQLRNWMRNHTKEGSKATASSSRLQKKIDASFKSGARTRLSHATEIYSQLYYDKLRDIVDEKFEDGTPEDGETQREKKSRRMKIRRDVVASAYEAETDEVKAEVAERLEVLKAARTTTQATQEGDSDDETDLLGMANAIREAPLVIHKFLMSCQRATGWNFTVLAGGPNPLSNGAIDVASFHVGTTTMGNTFGSVCPDFDDRIMAPYHGFCRKSFPQEIRTKRALIQDQDACGSSLPSSPTLSPRLQSLDPLEELQIPTPANISQKVTKKRKKAAKKTRKGGRRGKKKRKDLPSDSETEEDEVMSQNSESELEEPPTYFPDWPGPKSTYELEKEANIARNKILLQNAFGGGVDAVNASSSPLPDQPSTAPSPGRTSSHVPSAIASKGPQIPPPSSPGRTSSHVPSAIASTGPQIPPPSSPGRMSTSGDRRGSTSPPPPEAPDWVTDAMAHLEVKDLGEEWMACVRAWWKFEKAVGDFGTGTRKDTLPAIRRPQQIHWWISRARDFNKRPIIQDYDEYGRAWLTWWSQLQPSWRKPSQPGALPPAVYTPSTGDWGKLRVSGVNGLLIALISLWWWGNGVGGSSSQWKSLVTDIRRCMESMSGMAVKRGREAPPGRKSKRRRTS